MNSSDEENSDNSEQNEKNEQNEENEESEENEEDEEELLNELINNHSKSEIEEESTQNKIKEKEKIFENKELENENLKNIEIIKENLQVKKEKKIEKKYGPTFISEKEKEQYLSVSLNETKIDELENWRKDIKINDILDKTFNKIEKKEGKLDNFLNKRQKNNESRPLINEANEKESQEIKEYMKEYDEKFRPKSLLEVHKVK